MSILLFLDLSELNYTKFGYVRGSSQALPKFLLDVWHVASFQNQSASEAKCCTKQIRRGVGKITKSIFSTDIPAPKAWIWFPICHSISKPKCFRGNWGQKPRQNFTLFHLML